MIFAKRYKYLNKFGILHLIHSFSISNNYLEKSEYYLSVFFFGNIINEYYLKYNPKEIYLLINYINLFNNCIEYGKKIYPDLFLRLIKIILNNNYISTEIKKQFLIKIGINDDDYLYNNDLSFKEYNSINIFKNIRNKYIFDKNIKEITIFIYCIESKYLFNTINSLLNQKFINYEIIIIFDGENKKELNYIKHYIKNNKNIKLIVNKKTKGIFFSLTKGVLSSKGQYILFLESSYVIIKDNLLSQLYHKIYNYNLDILEFNLIINNKIDDDTFNLYKCTHIKSDINATYLKNNNLSLDIDQEKELLFNKLIKANFFKRIIKKFNLIDYKEVIFNYYDNILIFLLFKENAKFKHINIIGIMKTINKIKELTITKIKAKITQKRIDSFFYINFLIDNLDDRFISNKIFLNEYYNLLSIIINEYNIDPNNSLKFLKKMNNKKYLYFKGII